jgi:hypothetical protein
LWSCPLRRSTAGDRTERRRRRRRRGVGEARARARSGDRDERAEGLRAEATV